MVSGTEAATAVLATDVMGDSATPVAPTAPAASASASTAPGEVPALPATNTPAVMSDPVPDPTAASAVGDAPGTPSDGTTDATSTAAGVSADVAALAATGTNGAATKAATVGPKTDAVTPANGTPMPASPPAPATDATASASTTPDSGTGDTNQGSDPAPQTPATVVPSGPDAVQPAAAATAMDATQAPSLVVPTAVPTAIIPVATVSALPQSLTIDRERFVRLVDGLEARLRVSGSEGGKAMRMTLRPAELGDVTVRLQIAANGQSATATLLAQNHQTGDLLAQAAGDLRQALADRGLRLDRLEVTAGSLSGDPANDGAPSSASDPNRQDTRRTHYAFDARTDVLTDPTAGETAPLAAHEGLYVLA
jgi:flagellar hook-length control protein FliK